MSLLEPRLLVTIDTECDKSSTWRTATPLTFRGVTETIPGRLQPLFARHGIRPTYLLSPEVMTHPESVATLRSLRDVELTTHLHGDYIVPKIKTWDFAGSITDEMQWEYGEELERAKLATLTEMFQQQFGRPPLSFRAGRFGAGPHTGKILQELGYLIDSSVTPHVCWTSRRGVKRPDYRGYPEMPYTLGPEGDLAQGGTGGLLELPVTILPAGTVPGLDSPDPIWFRPWYSDADTLSRVLEWVLAQPPVNGVCRPLVMMFHNVELLAGASPYPQTEAEVQHYLDMLARVFELAARRGVKSCTMAEYHELFVNSASTPTRPPRPTGPTGPTGLTSPTQRPKDLTPGLHLPAALVEAALARHDVQPWFKYMFHERASRWDVVRPCQWIAQNIEPAAPILSIGAGVGFNLFWLAERGFSQLFGTDLDPKAVAGGREIARQSGLPVTLTEDDALAPQAFRSEQFAVIEALNWCHLIEGFSLDRLLDLYVPHLAARGIFVLDTIDASYGEVPGNQYHTADREKPVDQRRPSEYKSRFSEAEVRAAFARHGLEVEEILSEPQQIPKRVYLGRRTAPAAAAVPAPRRTLAGRKPRVMLMADVPNWIFARHCEVLTRLLGDEFDFQLKFQGQPYCEADYDLIYPLEWNLIPADQIRTPAKYVTGIRSHCSWAGHDFLAFADLLATRFQRIHCVSRRLTRLFAPFVPNTLHVTHGIDTSYFTPTTRADRSGTGRIRIGWAGNRINKTKGFEELIAPLARLPGVELVFCGYLDKNLDLEGMKRFYDSIDAYVCSSATHQEGNNNSLLEAAAMERALITTDNGTVAEYLVHGESALVIERELPNFIQAVCALRDDPERRVQMGRRARLAVQRAFEWRDMASHYRDFFWKALDHALAWRPPTGVGARAVAPKTTGDPDRPRNGSRSKSRTARSKVAPAAFNQRPENPPSPAAVTPKQAAAVALGLKALDSDDLKSALRQYRQARALGPSHPDLDQVVHQLESAVT